jgi:stearoyl-CoA desaturase (Delta-9 desaturase)
MPEALPASRSHRIAWLKSIPFFLVHAVAVGGVVWLGFSWQGLGLAIGLYYLRMFGVTAGYHRYFSHRTFRTSRAFQFVLALLAMSSTQKGVLWWASHHRLHHKRSDLPGDVHSVLLDGFVWSHMGWILSHRYDETDADSVRDLTRYPELRFFDRYHVVIPLALALLLFWVGGAFALIWGFFVSTTLLWHGTFTINSLSHVFGSRRYRTEDNSKNNLLLALITMGEGWHNNHHYYQRSASQGFFWWEIDLTFYTLRALQLIGVVWGVESPPKHVRDANQLRKETPATLPGTPVMDAPLLGESAAE